MENRVKKNINFVIREIAVCDVLDPPAVTARRSQSSARDCVRDTIIRSRWRKYDPAIDGRGTNENGIVNRDIAEIEEGKAKEREREDRQTRRRSPPLIVPRENKFQLSFVH